MEAYGFDSPSSEKVIAQASIIDEATNEEISVIKLVAKESSLNDSLKTTTGWTKKFGENYDRIFSRNTN